MAPVIHQYASKVRKSNTLGKLSLQPKTYAHTFAFAKFERTIYSPST